MPVISPSVGRVLWFWPGDHDHHLRGLHAGQPLAAIVAHVIDDRCVNVSVVDPLGNPRGHQKVPLRQDGDSPGLIPEGAAFCEWVPFQRGQVVKTEAAENALLERIEKLEAALATKEHGVDDAPPG